MRGLLLSCLLAGCGLTLDLTPPVGDSGFTGRDAGLDAIPPDAPSCTDDSDCLGLFRSEPPTPCSAEFRCQDNRCLANDQDGDGVGPGCDDERDCDDLNPAIGIEGTIPCPSAAPGICGESATLSCVDGAWDDACKGEQAPQTEVCNGLDDDCDGSSDNGVRARTEGTSPCERRYECSDGAWVVSSPPARGLEICGDEIDDDCDGTIDDPECVEACTYVALEGGPPGTLSSLDMALRSGPDGPRVICLIALLGGGECIPTRFELGSDLPPDTTIIGGFRPSDGGPVGRCTREHMTQISAPVGSVFSRATVQTSGNAQLIDLGVEYPPGTENAVAIRADGGTLLTSNVVVTPPSPAGPPDESTGIRVNRGARLVAVDTDVRFFGLDAFGIDAEGDVNLFNGCTSGPCACEGDGTGISGRGDEGRAVVVRGASLTAERYAICGQGSPALELDMATAFVANSALETFGIGMDVVSAFCSADNGIWLHGNLVQVNDANGGDSTGVSLSGPCGALLSSNTIRGLASGSTESSIGVLCDGAECALGENTIYGVDGIASAQDALGLVCTSDSGPGNCRFVTHNRIVGAVDRGTLKSTNAIGVTLLESTFSYLEGNQISGGCAEDVVSGLYGEGSTLIGRANRVVGLECATSAMGTHIGMDVTDSLLTWIGNTVHGGTASTPMGADCETYGAFIDARAVLRNNLFIGGERCGFHAAADLRGPTLLMAHNGFTLGDPLLDLDGSSYRDAGMLLSAYPLFVGHVFDDIVGTRGFASYPADLRLTTESPFYGAGSVPAGRTESGDPHSIPPSIGAYEL